MIMKIKQLTSTDFVKQICNDFGIESEIKVKKYYNEYPIINGKRKINSRWGYIIVDKQGYEHPYIMPNGLRNEDKIKEFDYIYHTQIKSIITIEKELGISIKYEKCRICEEGGWYTHGHRYFYKDFYCEI